MQVFFLQGAFLAMMCYNFGVDTYQKKMYEETVTWLRESFELGKGRNSIGSKNQVGSRYNMLIQVKFMICR
jgi:hypothetical protein